MFVVLLLCLSERASTLTLFYWFRYLRRADNAKSGFHNFTAFVAFNLVYDKTHWLVSAFFLHPQGEYLVHLQFSHTNVGSLFMTFLFSSFKPNCFSFVFMVSFSSSPSISSPNGYTRSYDVACHSGLVRSYAVALVLTFDAVNSAFIKR